jgi:hypothetical protein
MGSYKYWEHTPNDYVYDRIRWFVYVQDQMTKKQLVSFSEYYQLGGRETYHGANTTGQVNYKDNQDVLKEEICYAFAKHFQYKWNEVKEMTERLWGEGGNLNYDPNWTNIEPDWTDSESRGDNSSPITGSINIEDNEFYIRLVKYFPYTYMDEERGKLEKIRPKKPILPKSITEPIVENETIQKLGFWIWWGLGTGSVLFFVGMILFEDPYPFIKPF